MEGTGASYPRHMRIRGIGKPQRSLFRQDYLGWEGCEKSEGSHGVWLPSLFYRSWIAGGNRRLFSRVWDAGGIRAGLRLRGADHDSDAGHDRHHPDEDRGFRGVGELHVPHNLPVSE